MSETEQEVRSGSIQAELTNLFHDTHTLQRLKELLDLHTRSSTASGGVPVPVTPTESKRDLVKDVRQRAHKVMKEHPDYQKARVSHGMFKYLFQSASDM